MAFRSGQEKHTGNTLTPEQRAALAKLAAEKAAREAGGNPSAKPTPGKAATPTPTPTLPPKKKEE